MGCVTAIIMTNDNFFLPFFIALDATIIVAELIITDTILHVKAAGGFICTQYVPVLLRIYALVIPAKSITMAKMIKYMSIFLVLTLTSGSKSSNTLGFGVAVVLSFSFMNHNLSIT